MSNLQKFNFKGPDGYLSLLVRVKRALIEGQQRIEDERLATYWETGRIIYANILRNKDRAEYGAEILKRLAKDLNVSQRLLERCVQFVKIYPRLPIAATRPQFSWSHYRQLITISDNKKRLKLEQAMGRNAWSADELASRLKENKIIEISSPAKKSKPVTGLLTPIRGEIYTYQIVERPTVGGKPELLVDLGFGMFRKIPPRALSRLSKGDFVGENFKKIKAAAKDLYTYQAVVEKVIDGDTIKVRMELGYEDSCREVLRLRGIDCPEMDTKEGQEAKAFVQSYIKEAQMIIVRSSRSDKYDRYLADVFIPQEDGTGIYLNNLLLEKGHAQRWEG